MQSGPCAVVFGDSGDVLFAQLAGDASQVHVVFEVGEFDRASYRIHSDLFDIGHVVGSVGFGEERDGIHDLGGEAFGGELVERPIGVFDDIVEGGSPQAKRW